MDLLCRALEVSTNGYYAWRIHRPGPRALENHCFRRLVELHTKYPALGLDSLWPSAPGFRLQPESASTA